MIKAVVFDLFGTLTNGQANPEQRIIDDFKLDKSEAGFRYVEGVVCGTLHRSQEDYITCLISCLRLPDNKETRTRLQEIFRADLENERLWPETAIVLGQIKDRGLKLGLISDLPSPDYDFIRQSGLEGFFDTRTLSFETGVLKPDKRVFYSTLGRLGVMPFEAVMVGNSIRSDIAPALEIGMEAILFDPQNRQRHYKGRRIKNIAGVLDYVVR